MKYKNKLILVLLCIATVMSGCSSKSSDKKTTHENETPTYTISKDAAKELGDINVGDLLTLMKYELPISPQNKQYNKVLAEVKKSKATIIIENGSKIVARINGKDIHTGEANTTMHINYWFENNMLIKGPVIEKMNTVK